MIMYQWIHVATFQYTIIDENFLPHQKKLGRGGAHYNSLPNIPCIGILGYFHFYCMAILYPAPTNTHTYYGHFCVGGADLRDYTHIHTHHTYTHMQDIDYIIHSSCSIACLVQYVQVHTFSLQHIWRIAIATWHAYKLVQYNKSITIILYWRHS